MNYKAKGIIGLEHQAIGRCKEPLHDLFSLVDSPFGDKLTQKQSDLNLYDALFLKKSFYYWRGECRQIGKVHFNDGPCHTGRCQNINV